MRYIFPGGYWINKFSPFGGKSDFEIDTAIKQIVDEALVVMGLLMF